MKKFYYILLGIIFATTTTVLAVPSSSYQRTILPEADSTYNIGSSIKRWANGYFDNVDTGTITVSGLIVGNLDMGGYDISNGGTATFENFVATSTSAINYFLGNVGIGTTAPGYKLHVTGTGYFSDNLKIVAGGNLEWGNANNRIVGDLNYLRFDTNGSEKLRITTDGNVGIGTSTPPTKLTIDSACFELKSPDGSRSQCCVDNSDVLTCTGL